MLCVVLCVCRRSAEAKSCAGLSSELWECFVSFCAYPTDLGPALKAHASKLGAALSDLKATELHVVICKGLQALVEKNQEVVKYHAAAGNNTVKR